ncbi:MAG: GNAT family N-acetyltransferase [Nanoarchaeota archaeon]|nr:GNAT family N-acetyltransferase [Nanoarchaeota archaeon]
MTLIRKASLRDVPRIVDLWKEFMNDHDDIVLKRNKRLKSYTLRKAKAANNYKVHTQKLIKSKKGVILVAENDNELLGFTLLIIKGEIPIFKIKKIGYIADLFIRKKLRGKSIGSKLMKESIKWFRKKGLKYISVGLYADNTPAHSFYKKKTFFDYKIEMRRKI